MDVINVIQNPTEEIFHILRGIKSRKELLMTDFTFMNNMGNRISVFLSFF